MTSNTTDVGIVFSVGRRCVPYADKFDDSKLFLFTVQFSGFSTKIFKGRHLEGRPEPKLRHFMECANISGE